MKKMSQKVLSFVLALTMIVPMFVLPSFAEEASEEPEFTEGIAYGEDGYTNSKYSDIDSADSGYVQIGTNDITKATVTATFVPKLYYIKNGTETNGGAYYNGTGANRYTNYEKRELCVSLTNIASANSLTDVYTTGYVIWKDAEGNLGYTLSTYSMPDGKKAVNLYEITLGLTKTGLINSEITDNLCFWQVLKNGALKTNSFNTANNSFVTKEYTLDSGNFTYCDVDWHAYTYASDKKLSWWSANKPTGVSPDASGITWSVLKYTDNEYVMIYRNKNRSGNISFPSYSVNTKYYAPYDYRFGAEISGITLADLRGLTSIGFSDTFNGDQYIANIVFNEIISSVSTEATFSGMSSLERVWTVGQDVPEKGVVDLTSMSFKTINNRTFAAGSLVKTIKLPSVVATIKGKNTLGNAKTFDFVCSSDVEQLIIAYVNDKDETLGNGSTSAAKISVNGKSINTLIG